MAEYNPWPENCKVIEITAADNFVSEIGYKKCRDALMRYANVVLFISFPHSGGCAFDIGSNRQKVARSEIGLHYDEKKFRAL